MTLPVPEGGHDQGLLRGPSGRARWVLMAGAALGSTTVIAATTVSVIAANEIVHDSALVGAAGAAIIIGAAVGTSALAAVMARSGQRRGLLLGYAIAVAGALLAAWSVVEASFPGLLLGTMLIGFANSSTQLSRYASAEMAPAERRASAIGLVVWAATIGAVAGPALVPATASMAAALGVGQLVGPFLASAAIVAVAAVVIGALLRPDPGELSAEAQGAVEATRAVADARPGPEERPAQPEDVPAGVGPGGWTMREVLRRPAVATALVAMVVGQVVMVTIMSMTPLHMTDHGHGLAAVGVVISAHVLGMFALSPLTGRISDRIGPLDTILLGAAVLAVAALLAAAAPPDGGPILLLALFLLGYGWNLGFVAGSALLSSALAPAERTRAQGITDSLVWGSSAFASLSAGVVLAAVGFPALGVIGVLLLVLPVSAVVAMRGSLLGRNETVEASGARRQP